MKANPRKSRLEQAQEHQALATSTIGNRVPVAPLKTTAETMTGQAQAGEEPPKTTTTLTLDTQTRTP